MQVLSVRDEILLFALRFCTQIKFYCLYSAVCAQVNVIKLRPFFLQNLHDNAVVFFSHLNVVDTALLAKKMFVLKAWENNMLSFMFVCLSIKVYIVLCVVCWEICTSCDYITRKLHL